MNKIKYGIVAVYNKAGQIVAWTRQLKAVAAVMALCGLALTLAGKSAGVALMVLGAMIAISIAAFAQTDAAGVLDSVTTLITSWKTVAAGLCLFLIGLSIVRKLH